MRRLLIPVLLVGLSFSLIVAQPVEYYPGADYSPAIPTLKTAVGHDWGEEVSSYEEIERYLHRLAEASPVIQLKEYGKTWEGRSLYLLVISSPENLAAIDQIKAATRQLAFPGAGSARTDGIPCTVWLMYGVHGNEISSPNAALLLAYHLAASQGDNLVGSVLKNCVVIIDPLQNPDGRSRFVQYFRQTRGRWPDESPDAAEHNEDWPGGRSNHYLFDMNRDWFAQTQLETRGRVQAYLEWFPQVIVDLHEMGGDSTYYFAPPADPLNPWLTESQVDWLRRFGKNNARWFDQRRIDYFTREVFDSFYPGYGEGWPMFQGSVGMTYEEASVRGLVLRRDDGTILHFSDSVRNHFTASLATLETAADNHTAILESFAANRRSAIELGKKGDVREYLFPPSSDPERLNHLMQSLVDQGIQVLRARGEFSLSDVRGYRDDAAISRAFPAGTFIVPAAQPAGRLVQTLLDRQTPMPEEFLAEQQRRRDARERDQFYDVTGWALPLLYDVEAYRASKESGAATEPVSRESLTATRPGPGPAELAYIVPWSGRASARLLAGLYRKDIRVYAADKPFSLQGREFPAGTLLVKVKDNPADLHETLSKLASEAGAEIVPSNSGWVDEGINFGSNNVRYLRKPKVAIAYNNPTRSASVGATRYLVEQRFDYPVTILNSGDIGSADLSKFNVLILPDASGYSGGYSQYLEDRGVDRIKGWVREGGTLITLAGASEWLSQEKVGLLSTKTERRQAGEKADTEKPEEEKGEESYQQMIQPADEPPASIPGALVRVRLDPEHWLAFGYGGETTALVDGNRIFTPLKLDKGRNVGVYFPSDKLLLSGFAWNDTREQLGEKAYLMHERLGRGNIVAFAEDPSFRGFVVADHLLLMNAIFFGPAH